MTAARSPEGAAALAGALIELGALALTLGRIDGTACYHPDQVTAESDADHMVMLAWTALSPTALLYPSEVDTGLVAQLAVLHDAVEMSAGDTPALRVDATGKAAKAQRERVAAQ
jgi:putative hydrolases of HD superfamily